VRNVGYNKEFTAIDFNNTIVIGGGERGQNIREVKKKQRNDKVTENNNKYFFYRLETCADESLVHDFTFIASCIDSVA